MQEIENPGLWHVLFALFTNLDALFVVLAATFFLLAIIGDVESRFLVIRGIGKLRRVILGTVGVALFAFVIIAAMGAPPPPPPDLPVGTIVAWHADNGEPPNGWRICNGDNGTPNLSGKFLRGVTRLSEIGAEGGADTSDVMIPSVRLHLATGGIDLAMRAGERGSGIINHYCGDCDVINSYLDTGDLSGSVPTLPEFYSVVYIMKMSE